MDHHSGYVVTLANSIIGVSILAMPYCFKQTGILLAFIMLILSNLLTRLTCHFLIKSAIISRRKTFEYLAYCTFGTFGKFAIEVGMIGFLIGTCIAFFVVMGDLGPEFISELTGRDTSSATRTSILMALALFCVLPLGLLRNVQSLGGVSKATIGFYFCLVLKIIVEAMPHIFRSDWTNKVELWRPAGIIQCLPIFSMALSCQSQLFEIYQAVQNPSLEKMNHVVKNAIDICTIVYFCVGFFGYIAFAHKNFTGNILLSFEPSILTNVLKLGFVLSVAFSFPLVIFPCRASVHSLIYRPVHSLHEGTSNYMPEGRFKGITFGIIFLSLVVGILIPNIELVLGLVGSTIGIIVCVLFPVLCFIYISQRNTNETLLAKIIFVVGFALMILGTYENLHRLEKIDSSPLVENFVTEKKELFKIIDPPQKDLEKDIMDNKALRINLDDIKLTNISKIDLKKHTEYPEIRHEPPEPIEPQEVEKVVKVSKDEEIKIIPAVEPKVKEQVIPVISTKPNAIDIPNNSQNNTKDDEVDKEAIKKDETEMKLQQAENKADSHKEKDRILLDTIQKQNEVQKEIVKQQQMLIKAFQEQSEQKVKEEKMKAVKQIETIALEALEKISGDVKENKQILAKLEKDVKKTVNSEETKKMSQNNENKLDDMKIENILLNTVAKQNISAVSVPSVVASPDPMKEKPIKLNNTAPLLQNLGQIKKNDESPVAKDIPLPLLQANVSQIKNETEKKEQVNKDAESDNTVMRRDILQLKV